MAETPRPQAQIILDQLTAWLGEIRRDDGYYTNLGADVRTEQSNTDQNDEPADPSLYVFDDASDWVPPQQQGQSARGYWTQRYTLEALVWDDGNGRLLSRQVISDSHRALRRPITAWPPAAGVSALREIAREIPERPQGSDWIEPTVTLEVDYVDREQAAP